MNNKVKFLRGTAAEYVATTKDSDTIYFTTDDGKLYIGDKEISGDGSIIIDDTLSDTSENPVQNKVVNAALDEKASKDTMTGATSSAAGTSGLVPAPTVDDITKFLCGDGTWKTPDSSGSGTAYQMPYYVQCGTVSVNGYDVTITFPKKFKTPPVIMLSLEYTTSSSIISVSTVVAVLTDSEATIRSWGTSTSSVKTSLTCIVHWVALGELEE